ncbi:uncharacterized protein N7484_006379 [Penicillium longicatenatum]|uniref:uncharacterized protein n=1 Tax=Penicillium longicatenatum TaxID=1561947 RepID=UPI0025481C6A|nr:uncharacterized protein N7484_006379 [Penicillium longicatenatum]KAJ5643872.1 hypothetical protein N7484_006379 [Penicillium longicatenatum]
MSPKKQSSSKSAKAPERDFTEALAPAVPPLARIPSPARFSLVVLSSLILSSVGFTLTTNLTGDLGLVSKHLEEWWEVGGLVAWKAVEIGLSWVLGFDSWDVASFLYITHLPTYSLLTFFYGVRPTSTIISYAITVLSTVIPFFFLRRPASVHDLSHAPSGAVANRSILQDRPTTIYTTLAATSIFTVVLYASYASWLPAQLVVHFESIPDISAAHAGPAGLPVLFLTLIPTGYAVRDFLFVSSTGHATAVESKTNHEGELLICALYRKTWCQLSTKTRILVSRTLVLAAGVFFNTVVQVAGTIDSVSVEGASLWGAVWTFATVAVGAVFGWIEAVDGV